MGLKDNFYQALRELLNGGGAAGSDLDEKDKSQADFEDFETTDASSENESDGRSFADFMKLDDEEEAVVYSKSDIQSPKEELSEAESGPEKSFRDQSPAFAPKPPRANFFGRPSRPEPNVQYNPPSQPSEIDPSEPLVTTRSEEMTIISKSTVILGDIRSLANVTIDGKVRGNVNVLKDAHNARSVGW